MLSSAIIEQIKKKSVLEFNNAKDFEVLSAAFPAADRLGVNTLKRLMGYAKTAIEPRKTTLDAIAHYLGQTSWETLMGLQPSDSDWIEKAVCAGPKVFFTMPVSAATSAPPSSCDGRPT